MEKQFEDIEQHLLFEPGTEYREREKQELQAKKEQEEKELLAREQKLYEDLKNIKSIKVKSPGLGDDDALDANDNNMED